MNRKRFRILRKGEKITGPIAYWMSRDQRTNDNWALLFAQEWAIREQAPLIVVFCLVPQFLGATIRHYAFMLKGLRELEDALAARNIPFSLLAGDPGETLPGFIREHHIAGLVTDFDPLRIKRTWKKSVARSIAIPMHEVDAHNIVPCWIASSKLEYSAHTFRPKIHRLLPEFLDTYPRLETHPTPWGKHQESIDWDSVTDMLRVDRSIKEITWLTPGEKAANRLLTGFVQDKLARYEEQRNDPNQDVQSNLSPYLHFGQISARRVAQKAMKHGKGLSSTDAFLEALIVRRELSDNFCYYNPHYDTFEGFPRWAQTTLNAHRNDAREYLYPIEEFEHGRTHDDLWNAAQLEMVKRGKMHGYMRMYWAKKILEWSGTPEQALETAIYLNDRYELDGRDPNGYAGIAWSIGGMHDRAWKERPVFGKTRYMSYRGCNAKFDIKAYIDRIRAL